MTETLAALPVTDTLVHYADKFVFEVLEDRPGSPTLTPQRIAQILPAVPPAPQLELTAAALSHVHRAQGLLDPVYTTEVTRAIDKALRPPAPLTVRCANVARINLAKASSQEEQNKAAFALLTVNLMREAQLTARMFSMLKWSDLLDGRYTLTAYTTRLVRDLSPADTSARPYPVATGSTNGHLSSILTKANIFCLYTVSSGSQGIYHDMTTAGALQAPLSPYPTREEGVAFLENLQQIPLP